MRSARPASRAGLWVMRIMARPKLLPKGTEELQDFLLRCGVERRGRFIGNDEGRPAGDGLRDEHPLALAAAQLVGVGAGNAFGVRGKHGGKNVGWSFRLRARLSKDSWAARTSLTCRPTWRVGWSEEEGS